MKSNRSAVMGAGLFCLVTVLSLEAQIFWAQDGHIGVQAGDIMRTELDGSATTELYGRLNRPLGVAAHPASGMVYWAEEGIFSGHTRVARAPIDGDGSMEVLYDGDDFVSNAQMVMVHEPTSSLVWTTLQGVYRGSLDGTVESTLLGGSAEPFGFGAFSIDPLADRLFYWDRRGGAVYRMNIDGSDDRLIADDFSGNVRGLATDGVYLYYSDANAGTVTRMNLDATERTVIADVGAEADLRGVDVGPDGRVYFGGQQSSIWSVLANGDDLQHITDVGTDRLWGISVIPEPGTYALIFGIAAGVVILLRRRFQRCG